MLPITVTFTSRVPRELYLSQGMLTTWAVVALGHWLIGSPEPSLQATSLLILSATWFLLAGIRAVARQTRIVNFIGDDDD